MIVNGPLRSAHRTLPSEQPSRIDRWIPWMFVAFLAVVLVANGTLVAIALSTWTGLSTTNAYQKGLAYNQTLEAARAQAALGWQAELVFTQLEEQRGRLDLFLKNAAGVPIERAEVRASLVRPTQQGHDFDLLLESRGGGKYTHTIEVPIAGIWDTRVNVEKEQQVFYLQRRILVR
jgi:nitrogen fixation protein FixH